MNRITIFPGVMLQKSQLDQIRAAGAAFAYCSVPSDPQYPRVAMCCYFLTPTRREVAHLSPLALADGKAEVNLYSRQWGDHLDNAYSIIPLQPYYDRTEEWST